MLVYQRVCCFWPIWDRDGKLNPNIILVGFTWLHQSCLHFNTPFLHQCTVNRYCQVQGCLPLREKRSSHYFYWCDHIWFIYDSYMIWNLESAKISQDTKKFDCFDMGYPRSLEYNCHSWNASQWNRIGHASTIKMYIIQCQHLLSGRETLQQMEMNFDISQSKVAPKNSMVHAKHSQTSVVLCAQNFHPCHFADMPCPSGQATQRPPAWKLDLADLQDAPCGDTGHATSQRLCGDKACYLWDIMDIQGPTDHRLWSYHPISTWGYTRGIGRPHLCE